MYMVKQPQERRLQRETEGNMIEEKMASGQGKKHSFWSPSNVVPVSSCQVCDVYTPPHRPIFHNSLPTSHLAQIINNSSFPTICSWRQVVRPGKSIFSKCEPHTPKSSRSTTGMTPLGWTKWSALRKFDRIVKNPPNCISCPHKFAKLFFLHLYG